MAIMGEKLILVFRLAWGGLRLDKYLAAALGGPWIGETSPVCSVAFESVVEIRSVSVPEPQIRAADRLASQHVLVQYPATGSATSPLVEPE
jgi:hypothetical protein